MKTITPTSPRARQPRAVLLIGPPGSTKSTLMMEFARENKVHIIDCDLNLDGPENFLKAKYKTGLSYTLDQVMLTDDGTRVEIADCFDRLIKLVIEATKLPQDVIICMDGLTPVNEFLRQKVMKKQNAVTMETRFWDPFKTEMLGLMFGRLRTMNHDVILTCHESIETKASKTDMMVEEIVSYEPSVQGKISNYFGGFFTDVWRCSLDPKVGAPGQFVSKIQTIKGPKTPHLKNSLGMPSEITEVTWEKIEKFWVRG